MASMLNHAAKIFKPNASPSLNAGNSISVTPTESNVPAASAVITAVPVLSRFSLAAMPISIPSGPDTANQTTRTHQRLCFPWLIIGRLTEPTAKAAKPLWQAIARTTAPNAA